MDLHRAVCATASLSFNCDETPRYPAKIAVMKCVTRGLRVLDLSFNYPHIAESYIDAEIRHLLGCGVQVFAWSSQPAPAPGPVPDGVEMAVGEPIAPIVARFQPDIIHLHWLMWNQNALDVLAGFGRPMTARVHTDTTRERLQMYCAHPAVRRVYIYPGDSERFDFVHDKLSALPVVIERQPALSVARDRRLILRAASLSPRDQAMMVALAHRLPEYRVVMCLADNAHRGANSTVDEINAAITALKPNNLSVLWNVTPGEMARWYAQAGIYVHTFPAEKTAAMPVSIGQALSAGCYTLVRNQPRLASMVGAAGAVYASLDEVVQKVRDTQTWSEADWAAHERRSRAEGEKYCADQAVAPMLEDWLRFADFGTVSG